MLMASLIKEGIEKQELKEDIDIISLASFLHLQWRELLWQVAYLTIIYTIIILLNK